MKPSAVAAAIFASSLFAFAAPAAPKHAVKEVARSIGAPNKGKLEGAVLLKGTKHLKNRKGSHSWGTPELVHLLRRAAAEVAKKHKGSELLVGDLSGRTGGFLEKHNSHQSGRDADVAFYVMNSKGKPIATKRFIAFDGSGHARDVDWALFDDARNWDLVEALLKDEKANVRYLFIADFLRARLLKYAASHHATREMIEKAAAAMMSPADADVHDDHFHVRIRCPASARPAEASGKECIEDSVPRAMPYEGKVAKDDAPTTAAAPKSADPAPQAADAE